MRALMRLVRLLFAVVANLAVLAVLLALLAGAGYGAWQLLPQVSKDAITKPFDTLQSAKRGAERAPRTPLTALIIRIADWFAEQRDLVDVVRSADGTAGGLNPLPEWTSVDGNRVFGATETIWQPRRAKLAGVRWSRVVFAWSDVQPGGPRDWRARFYLRDDMIDRERKNGVEVVGLLMHTPRWAAARPAEGTRSVPSLRTMPQISSPVSRSIMEWSAIRSYPADMPMA